MFLSLCAYRQGSRTALRRPSPGVLDPVVTPVVITSGAGEETKVLHFGVNRGASEFDYQELPMRCDFCVEFLEFPIEPIMILEREIARLLGPPSVF